MMTKTRIGHRATSAVRPALTARSTGDVFAGAERLRRAQLGGAVVRPGAYGAPTLPRGDVPACAPAVLTS